MYERLVKEVMQRELMTCLAVTPIEEVMHRLVEHNVHALVVVDEDGYAIGIVSQTDVLLAYRVRTAGEIMPELAGEIMSSALITCSPTTTLLEAVTLMTRNHIHRLVVAKPEATCAYPPCVYPLGILSMTDIIRHLNQEMRSPVIVRLQTAGAC